MDRPNYDKSYFFKEFHHTAYLEQCAQNKSKSTKIFPKFAYLTRKYADAKKRSSPRSRVLKQYALIEPKTPERLDDRPVKGISKTQDQLSRNSCAQELWRNRNASNLSKSSSAYFGVTKSEKSTDRLEARRLFEETREESASVDLSRPTRADRPRSIETRRLLVPNGPTIARIKSIVSEEKGTAPLAADLAKSSTWSDIDCSEVSRSNVKFPRETKGAMIMTKNNPRTKSFGKGSREKDVRHIETQTTPKPSRTEIKINVFQNNVPCHKNLLCRKGAHPGKCCAKPCRFSNERNDGRVRPERGRNRRDVEVRTRERATSPNKSQEEDVEEISSPSNMNGMNGHANGELNGCDIITQNQQKGCWTIGLINSKFRYLTAETFGFKINANGASLKKKQIWTLEPDQANGGESYIYLRSHLDKYLAVDSFGNVTCESDEKEPGSKFQISVAEDGSGRWALRNVVRGYFLGSSLDKLTCTAKVPGDAEFWHVHLAARPQVNLRSIGRKRFAHLSENLDEIHVDANIPWGEDTLFTLEFRADESGKYALHTCNNKYLSMGGKLVDVCNKDCLFAAEYHSGQLALRDRNGAYLSPIGSKAVLKTRSNTVTKDELFSLEDSLPQASFVAALNSRYVSVKQGVDLTANQDEISDYETFQLEFDWTTKRWYIRTMQDRYWTLETGGGIQAAGDKRSSNALFDLIWQGDGSVAFRANNGRYVITKRSGHLYATSDNIDDNCKYFFYLINRPILVLKSEQGFVGYKSSSSPKLECNKATYETIQVERAEKGVIYFKGQNGKYWHCDTEGVTADSDVPEGFYLELREPTRLSIKSVNGSYLSASKNGSFRLGESSFESATQWEY